MPFEVRILGCSSGTPTSTRHTSAQIVNLLGRFFLIDCGEGTQIQLRRYGVKIQKIEYICISHLHGDHYLGLMGLLSTMSLLNRKKELIIFVPKGLDQIINLHLKLSYSKLSFEIKMIFLKGSKMIKIFEDDAFELFSFGLKHSIPCWGFKLVEKKRPKRILKTVINQYDMSFSDIKSIKLGMDFITKHNKVIPNDLLTQNSYKPRSYVYCSDTMYFDKLVDYVKDVDLLYHESTFHSEMSKKARTTFHSTAKDAGRVAFEGNVKQLLLGHFSPRYKELNVLKLDAQSLFKNTLIVNEGAIYKIKKTFK